MKTCIICFSDSGAMLAMMLKHLLDGAEVHSTEKYASKYGFISHVSLHSDMESLFHGYDALIFISACGIAVRLIAPFVKDKTKDPAVIVMDDRGRFVIPVLSGHIGGANALAERISDLMGSVPVITTATDGAGRFSCDAWAAQHGCAISSMKTAKDISTAILTEDIPISSEFELPDVLPNGLIASDEGELGIYIGIRKNTPYKSTLRLVPRIVTLGIGCRRDMPKDAIMDAVRRTFAEHNIDIKSISSLASVDVKKDEKGLLECAEELGAAPVFYPASELEALEGDYEESEFVKKTVGTGNVCERAAAMTGGELIIRKTSCDGVTVAAAVQSWRIEF